MLPATVIWKKHLALYFHKKQTMKNLPFIILCIALIGCASPQQQEQNDTTMNKDNNELTAFDVQKEFQKNGFDWFTENLILCSGDRTESNAMTI